MTPDDVRTRVAQIAEMTGDPEGAHRGEDKLMKELLSAIAAGDCADPRGCAAEMARVFYMDFERWYA